MMFFHKAELAGYSSVVGQPIMLLNERGECIGHLSLTGYMGANYTQAVSDIADALNEITRLRARLAEARLSEIAALGQAQDIYTAQQEAEARAIRVGEAVRGSAADMRDELADVIGAAPTSSIHSALSEYRNAIRALDVSDIAKGKK